MSAPAYDLLLVAHILVALVGFGAVAVAGYEASRGRRCDDPAADEGVKRFFRSGTDWPARAIFLVPLIGLGLLFGGDRSQVTDAWPWIGLFIWTVAAGLATAWCWPAERRAQAALARLAGAADEHPDGVGEFRRACRQMERACGAMSLCFLAAVVVMVWQP